MTNDEKLRLLDELRVAEKMFEALYQLGQSRSALNSNSVLAFSGRGKAAMKGAKEFAAKIEASD